MKTEKEIRAKIAQVQKANKHVLEGDLATLKINAPRALEQVAAENTLHALHWALGEKYTSKLKGVN